MGKNYVFLRYPGFLSKALTFSYDDGAVYDRQVVDILAEKNLKATFNLSSGLLSDVSGDKTYLSLQEAVRLYFSAGCEIAVHGREHLSLEELDEAGMVREILTDRIALERAAGRPVTGMAYANGNCGENSVRAAHSCGIRYARTVLSSRGFRIPQDRLRFSPTCHHGDPKLASLTEEFLGWVQPGYFWQRMPLLFCVWGHSFEFQRDNNWDVLRSFARSVGGRDDIWYATCGEIFSYVEAYENLLFTAEGDKVYNPASKDVFLCSMGKEILVPSGQTVCIKN